MQHHQQQEPTQHQTKNTFTNLGRNFQEKVMQALIVDRIWAASFVEVFEVDTCFEYAELKLLANRYINHYNQYKEFPSLDLLISVVKEDFKNNTDILLKERMVTFLKRVAGNKDLGDLGWVKDKAFSFCRQQQVKKALLESAEISEDEEQYDLIVSKMKKAISSGIAMSDGLDYVNDVDARYSETYRRCISTGIKELDERKMLNGGLGGGEIGVVVAPTGCHAKGTEILMLDGSVKLVEDINVGDKLMGPDSMPRTVLKLVGGTGPMYKITTRWGDEYVVNDEHTLALTSCDDEKGLVEITVKDYISKTEAFKERLFWFQPEDGIEFEPQTKTLPIDPYILGLILGDGSITSKRIGLTSADLEIVEAFKDFANQEKVQVSTCKQKGTNKALGYYLTNAGKHNNPVRAKLELLGLMRTNSGTKFVPQEYKTASKQSRLALLAGLIDTDGYMNLSANTFEYCSKSKRLADDFVFLCRSVGLNATLGYKIVKGTSYARVHVGGKTSIVPTRLQRKQAKEKMKFVRRPNVCNFTVEPCGTDDFYGFTVDHDNLYLSAKLGVIRNCGKTHLLVGLGAEALTRGKNVLHYTLELNERIIGVRYDSNLVNISSTDCIDNQEKIKDFFVNNVDKLGRLRIKHLPSKSTTVNTLRAHMEKLKMKDFAPDLILVDYAGIMRSTSKYDLLRMELKEVIQELRDLAEEMDIPVWTALQSNKAGASSDIVDLTNMAESYGQAHIADVVLGLSRKSENKATGLGHLFVAKNRAGMDGILYPIHMDTAKSKIRVLSGSEAQDFEAEVEQRIDETTTKTNMIAAKNFQKVMNENKGLFQRT